MIYNLVSYIKTISPDEYKITLSTWITIVRIILAPVIVFLLIEQYISAAFWVFVCAAVTDMLDGILARVLDQKTLLGACLDPIADKILIVSCFFSLAWITHPLLPIPRWLVWFMLGKEIVLIIGAICVYQLTGIIRVVPTLLGKITTCIQIGVIIWTFLCYFFSWSPLLTYNIILYSLCCLIIITLLQYSYIGLRIFHKNI